MSAASPTGLPGGDSGGRFAGSWRAGSAGEIWKVRCVGRELQRGTWLGAGKGAVSQAVSLQGQFWSDSSLLPYLLSFLPRLLSITKGQNIHQALGTRCLQSGGADRHWTESCSESSAVITGRRNLGVDKKKINKQSIIRIEKSFI